MTTTALPPLRLVRRVADTAPPVLDAAQQRVVAHDDGPLLVLAGPGAGKTTTLVESVAARVAAGLAPEQVLVLTFSRRAAGELRARVAARVGGTVTSPLALTFHSYAFALLRREASRRGEPPPVLLSGPEQDLVLRELLAGEVADGASRWPRALRPALPTRAFAEQLRDLLLRARERGWQPADLAEAGLVRDRPEWVAAAATWSDYVDRFALAPGPRVLDHAALVSEAAALLEGTRVGEEERRARAAVLVDEYQDVDPAQERLLQALAGGGRHLVAVGDPDQSIYAFRGADVSAVLGFRERFPTAAGSSAPVAALTTCRRLRGPALVASRRVAARLPVGGLVGAVAHRSPREVAGAPTGVDVRVAASASAEAALVADVLRRAHLLGLPDGPEAAGPPARVPWSRMAVLVRSAHRTLPAVRRALAVAGVPAVLAGEEVPLAQEPAVAALLHALDVALPRRAARGRAPHQRPPDASDVVALLTGPVGGVDPLALRRLRRALRAAPGAVPGDDLLVALLHDAALRASLPRDLGARVERVARVVSAVRAAAGPAATGRAGEALWAAWEAAGLAEPWEASSRAGGEAGRAADRALDAVVALFAAAETFDERLPGAEPAAFLDHLRGREVPGDVVAEAAPAADAVRLLTAHRSKGLEWDVVVVAGVQEGVWPDLRLRGSLLGSEDVRDDDAGASAASREADLLAEERRLFYVACTRARRSLVVTAVGSGEDDAERPSRFLAELVPGCLDPGEDGRARAAVEAPRPLDLRALVAELRSVVTDPGQGDAERDAAAARLRRLAAAGVPGADPSSWWGLRGTTDDEALVGAEGDVVLSPSDLEAVLACPLRWVLTRVAAGDAPAGAAQGVGMLVHALVAAATAPAAPAVPDRAGQAEGEAEAAEAEAEAEAEAPDVQPPDVATLRRRLDEVWPRLDLGGGPWWARRERERASAMLDRALAWAAQREGVVAVEERFEVRDPSGVVLRGAVDRLERDAQGRAVVVDLKTGSTAPSTDEVARHTQLGAYQHAVALGAFQRHGLVEPAGAALVHVGKAAHRTRAKVQTQHPPAADPEPGWAAEQVRAAAAVAAGSTFPAVPQAGCRSCPVRGACPAQPEGRTVVP